MTSEPTQAVHGWQFVRAKKWLILVISAAMIVPCLWHRHIEAGDLGSHVYNAWLAQLIEKGQAPGLYIVRQWNNVLFDWLLLHTANIVGFAAAEKIVLEYVQSSGPKSVAEFAARRKEFSARVAQLTQRVQRKR